MKHGDHEWVCGPQIGGYTANIWQLNKIVLTCVTEKMIETYWSSHFDWQPPIDQPFLRSHGLSKPFEKVWWISNYQLKTSIGRGRFSLDLKMHKWASCQWSKDGLIRRMKIKRCVSDNLCTLGHMWQKSKRQDITLHSQHLTTYLPWSKTCLRGYCSSNPPIILLYWLSSNEIPSMEHDILW